MWTWMEPSSSCAHPRDDLSFHATFEPISQSIASLLRGGSGLVSGKGSAAQTIGTTGNNIINNNNSCHDNGNKKQCHPLPVIGRFLRRLYSDQAASSSQSLHSLFPLILSWKSLLGVTVALYVLNQSHLLPRPLSSLVSHALFWPTMPITWIKRMGHWTTVMDDTVIMGGAPLSLFRIPDKLFHTHGVRAVINMCEEYRGPLHRYKALGIQELYLPTTDHFEPSIQALQSAVALLQDYANRNERVYVHCRAGHGRSGAVVMAWAIHQHLQHSFGSRHVASSDDAIGSPNRGDDNDDDDDGDNGGQILKQLNQELCLRRKIRRTLWKQPNIQQYYQMVFLEKLRDDVSDRVAVADELQQEFMEQQRNNTVESVVASSSVSPGQS